MAIEGERGGCLGIELGAQRRDSQTLFGHLSPHILRCQNPKRWSEKQIFVHRCLGVPPYSHATLTGNSSRCTEAAPTLDEASLSEVQQCRPYRPQQAIRKWRKQSDTGAILQNTRLRLSLDRKVSAFMYLEEGTPSRAWYQYY